MSDSKRGDVAALTLANLPAEIKAEVLRRATCKDVIRTCSTSSELCGFDVMAALVAKSTFFNTPWMQPLPFFNKDDEYVAFINSGPAEDRRQAAVLFGLYDVFRPNVVFWTSENHEEKQRKLFTNPIPYPFDPQIHNEVFQLDWSGYREKSSEVGDEVVLGAVNRRYRDEILALVSSYFPEEHAKSAFSTRRYVTQNPARVDVSWLDYAEDYSTLCELKVLVDRLVELVAAFHSEPSRFVLAVHVGFNSAAWEPRYPSGDVFNIEVHKGETPRRVVLSMAEKEAGATDFDLLQDMITALTLLTSESPRVIAMLKGMSACGQEVLQFSLCSVSELVLDYIPRIQAARPSGSDDTAYSWTRGVDHHETGPRDGVDAYVHDVSFPLDVE